MSCWPRLPFRNELIFVRSLIQIVLQGETEPSGDYEPACGESGDSKPPGDEFCESKPPSDESSDSKPSKDESGDSKPPGNSVTSCEPLDSSPNLYSNNGYCHADHTAADEKFNSETGERTTGCQSKNVNSKPPSDEYGDSQPPSDTLPFCGPLDPNPKVYCNNAFIADEDDHTATDDKVKTDTGETVSEGHSKPVKGTNIYDDAPNGGWGWAVTFCAFMVGLILDGIAFSFGVLFIHLLDHFQSSKSQISWIISVLNGTYLGIGPISSVLVAVFGCRKVAVFGAFMAAVSFFLCSWSPNVPVMIVLYGLFGGCGLGLLYLPSLVSVGHYFTTKRALATGIAVCGSGIGAFVFAPLTEFLVEMYTWKGAMWIISAIVLNGVPIAMILRPLEDPGKSKSAINETDSFEKNETLDPKTDVDKTGKGGKTRCYDWSKVFDFDLLRSPTFLVYGCSCFLCMFGFFIPFVYIPALALDFGMTSQQGALLISIIGILNTVARVGVGWLADRPWMDAVVMNVVALVIGGVATMFVTKYELFSLMAVYASVFGVSIAVFVSLRSIIMAELLGIEKLTSSFGLVTMFQGLSAFIGAPVAGMLSDLTGDYQGAFYLAGATLELSGIICIPLRRISRWEKGRGSEFNSDIEYSVNTKERL